MSEQKPEYVNLTISTFTTDDCLNEYARQGYYLVSVTPLGRDGEFSPPRVLFTMRLMSKAVDLPPAVLEAPGQIAELSERVKALEKYMGELVLDPQGEDPLVERLEALERRLDILWAEQPREVLP